MPSPTREDLDRRIVECWRAGMRSAEDIGRRIGLDRMHVGRRIARMVRARSWPFESPTKRRQVTALFTPLSLRLRGDLHTRLRAYCRETGATVSETVAEALDGFLQGKDTKRR